VVVGAAPKDPVGIPSGALNSVRQTGAVLGVAVLGAILAAGTSTASGVVSRRPWQP
jgi:DHA2 family methylenomycin A resistance protein-like MFS transporter